MPPVSSSRSYDYDFDALQPYFLLDGEDDDLRLPPGSQLLPGPGEDIWKKFELLPTPPPSPRRRPSEAAAAAAAAADLPEAQRCPPAALLQSFIIQDCMWSSSFAAAAKLEQAVSQRLASLQARRDATAPDQRPQVSAGYLQDLHTAASDCIDPSEVFPLGPASDGAAVEAPPAPSPGSPPRSSDSQSEEEEEEDDSDDDGGGEEEEEEEEEEEIDVVTVDRRRSDGGGRTDELILKRSHVNIHQHNYAAPQPAGKRFKRRSGSPPAAAAAARRSGGRRSCSPRSDGEDKRRTHNVLERRRRKELKRSFAALRDQIPALAHNQKAAKVTILKTAAEVVAEMSRDERRLLETKDELRKRSRALTRRLQQLRRSRSLHVSRLDSECLISND